MIIIKKTSMDNEVIKLFKSVRLEHLLIVVLFNGDEFPKYCTHMPLNPEPRTDIPINDNFSEIYFKAIETNYAIHDGAVMIQVDRNPPILRGWSYRIYPPPHNSFREENRGCAYNSSFDFSVVDRIENVYLIHKNGILNFIKGKVVKI